MLAAASDPVLVQIAPYIVAVVSIVGSLVAVVMNRRAGHDAWLRDKRFASYSSFLHETDEYWDAIAESHLAAYKLACGSDPTNPEATVEGANGLLARWEQARERCDGAAVRTERVGTECILLGPLAVGGPALDMVSALREADAQEQRDNFRDWYAAAMVEVDATRPDYFEPARRHREDFLIEAMKVVQLRPFQHSSPPSE
jgi:hypothetical protein